MKTIAPLGAPFSMPARSRSAASCLMKGLES